MSALRPHRYGTTSRLVQHILETPELVSAIQNLPGTDLARLVDHVGLEDAGELLLMARDAQLQDLLDEQLWRSQDADAEEHFDAERFGLWLRVLHDLDETALLKFLAQMSPQLLALGLHSQVRVLDTERWRQQLSGDPEEAAQAEKALESALFEEWEEFALLARYPDSWDALWAGILLLDQQDYEFLRDTLTHCAQLCEAELAEYESLHDALSDEAALQCEARTQRDERRAAAGHVSYSDARAFIALAQQQPATQERDPITRAYFRDLADSAGKQTRAVGHTLRAQPLLQALREASIVPAAPADVGSARPTLPSELEVSTYEALLTQLRAQDSQRYETRLHELSYLANVLLALPRRDEQPAVEPFQGLKAALALCDLGLQQCTSSRRPAGQAAAEYPADTLFHIAIHQLQHQHDLTIPEAAQPFAAHLCRGRSSGG